MKVVKEVGWYRISEKCILPTKSSDFNQTICQNIKFLLYFYGEKWMELKNVKEKQKYMDYLVIIKMKMIVLEVQSDVLG